jgi:hypothetical protein
MAYLAHHSPNRIGVFALCVVLVRDVEGRDNGRSNQKSLHPKTLREISDKQVRRVALAGICSIPARLAGLTCGADAHGLAQWPDTGPHLQTIAERFHCGSVTWLGSGGRCFRRLDQTRQPSGAVIGTR